ncbi:manganese and iron superoxide dismutase [Lentithecium fluviatile CBS 122367]|uniref:Manganese and iron superoxide dismutase n=1 Tax=Lentithecium fluviatile CBS 122367 TaxID=1168545 RepID=A0A6G1J2G3_9PLEO|nr:manganese and iron superoxide dismutase [Lentithecium fluviatile CBS 122367]
MIIRSLVRRPGAVQCLVQRCRATPSPFSARNLHSKPTLDRHAELLQNGIPGLFTPKGFNIAYEQYHQHIVDGLNEATSGTEWENQEPKALVVEWARNPMTAYGFNMASMAFNNHFFFKGINTDPNTVSAPPTDLLPEINKHFTSLETLKETFLATADAMFGPGFVWLVQQDDTATRKLSILTTYLAGSPLAGAHWRRQSHDLNHHNADSYQGLNPVGSFGSAARQEPKLKKPLGGVDVVPLLCVNTWEHVWLQDYGIGGKRDYLEAWWDRIDWNKVRDNGDFRGANVPFSQGVRKFAF